MGGSEACGCACPAVHDISPIPVAVGPIATLGRLRTPALRWPLAIRRGDSLELVFRLYREVCNTSCGPSGSGPLTLTGFSGRACVRRAKGHPVLYTLTVDVDQTGAPSSTRGEITVRAGADVTLLLPDHGVWDLEITDGTPQLVKTIVEGVVCHTEDVCL